MTLSSERFAARRLHLIEVAQALIRERGDAGFSMTMLAERAGVSAATPYNLLGSKSEILRRVIRNDYERFVGELAVQTGDSPLHSLLIAADRLVSHYEADRQFHLGLFRAAFSINAPEVRAILSDESRIWWKSLVQAAIDSGEIGCGVQSPQLTDALLTMMGGIVQGWIAANWPPERFALEMSASVRLVLASVCAPARRKAMVLKIAELHADIRALPPNRRL